MKMKSLLIFTSLLLSTAVVQANVINLKHEVCIDVSLNKAVASITRFTDYPSLPGATLTRGPFDMLTMFISLVQVNGKYVNDAGQPVDQVLLNSLLPTKVGEKKHVSIGTVLQPVPAVFDRKDKSKRKLFPSFWLNCEYGYTSNSVYKQDCHQDLSDDAPRFAVVGFDSEMTLTESGCKSGQTHLNFSLKLSTNDLEVKQIKSALVSNNKTLTDLVIKLFDEQSFFLDYFKNFYDGWAKSL